MMKSQKIFFLIGLVIARPALDWTSEANQNVNYANDLSIKQDALVSQINEQMAKVTSIGKLMDDASIKGTQVGQDVKSMFSKENAILQAQLIKADNLINKSNKLAGENNSMRKIYAIPNTQSGQLLKENLNSSESKNNASRDKLIAARNAGGWRSYSSGATKDFSRNAAGEVAWDIEARSNVMQANTLAKDQAAAKQKLESYINNLNNLKTQADNALKDKTITAEEKNNIKTSFLSTRDKVNAAINEAQGLVAKSNDIAGENQAIRDSNKVRERRCTSPTAQALKKLRWEMDESENNNNVVRDSLLNTITDANLAKGGARGANALVQENFASDTSKNGSRATDNKTSTQKTTSARSATTGTITSNQNRSGIKVNTVSKNTTPPKNSATAKQASK